MQNKDNSSSKASQLLLHQNSKMSVQTANQAESEYRPEYYVKIKEIKKDPIMMRKQKLEKYRHQRNVSEILKRDPSNSVLETMHQMS